MPAEKSLIDKITDLKDQYYALEESIDGQDSARHLSELMRIKKELSCLCLDLAKETGKAFRVKGKAKTRREIATFLKQEELMESGTKVTAAEAKAKQFTRDLLQDESDKEGVYMTAKLILNQANAVLESIKQDISIVKKEYENFNDRD